MQKLPQKVVKDGKLIDIRDDLQKNLSQPNQEKPSNHPIKHKNDEITGTYEVPTDIQKKE